MLHPIFSPILHSPARGSSQASSPSHGSQTSSGQHSSDSLGSPASSTRSQVGSPVTSPRLAPRPVRASTHLVLPMAHLSDGIHVVLAAYEPQHHGRMRLSHLLHLLHWDVLLRLGREFAEAAMWLPAQGQNNFSDMHAMAKDRLRIIACGQGHFDDRSFSQEGYTWAHIAARFAQAPQALLPALKQRGVSITATTQEGDTVLHALMRNTHAHSAALAQAARWAVAQGVSPHAQDVLGANAALIAALYLANPVPVLALFKDQWPDALAARDARGWGVADGVMANVDTPIDTLLYALTDCRLLLDAQRPAAWRVDLRGIVCVAEGDGAYAWTLAEQVAIAAHKSILGGFVYEEDQAARA